MRIVAVLPHFLPDVAPTGVIGSRIVEELGARGHRIEVITALPWYLAHAVDPAWRGRPVRRETTPWGSITRLHPFPTGDKRNIPARAAGFSAFCAAAAATGSAGGRADVVLAMSPPLPMAATGWVIARARRAPLVLNVQDIFPDVAVELGVLRGGRAIAAAAALERWSYARSSAVTVLSEDMRANLETKVRDPLKLRVIPNFVDVEAVQPGPRLNAYRRDYGLGSRTVVMYAGNVGMSQNLDLLVHAARATADRGDVVYVVNGGGSGLADVQRAAADLPNVVFVPMQPLERLPEVLAAADVHVVALRAGLSRNSVPSKTYSILAAGRPVLAAVDAGSEVQRVVETAGAGAAVPPDDPAAFLTALRPLLDDAAARERMGQAGRAWVLQTASPTGVGQAYEDLFTDVANRHRGPHPPTPPLS